MRIITLSIRHYLMPIYYIPTRVYKAKPQQDEYVSLTHNPYALLHCVCMTDKLTSSGLVLLVVHFARVLFALQQNNNLKLLCLRKYVKKGKWEDDRLNRSNFFYRAVGQLLASQQSAAVLEVVDKWNTVVDVDTLKIGPSYYFRQFFSIFFTR